MQARKRCSKVFFFLFFRPLGPSREMMECYLTGKEGGILYWWRKKKEAFLCVHNSSTTVVQYYVKYSENFTTAGVFWRQKKQMMYCLFSLSFIFFFNGARTITPTFGFHQPSVPFFSPSLPWDAKGPFTLCKNNFHVEIFS